MRIGEICNREVISAPETLSAAELSRLMLREHVGSVVIVRPSDHGDVPVGIVTDRDLVLEVLAHGLDPDKTSAGDVMTGEPVTAHHSAGVLETMRRMRSNGIRRLPVIDYNQSLVGILTLDDLIDVIVSELGELSSTIASGQYREKLHRRAGTG